MQILWEAPASEAADRAREIGILSPLLVGGRKMSFAMPRFCGYHPNPDFQDCLDGVRMYREHHCDGIIALGGGSCMDTAKGILACLAAPSPEEALQARLSASVPPLLAVPSTAGSGSEATDAAVLYVQGRKISLAHPRLLPTAVLLDPELLRSLPDRQRISCAMDALCQALESLWSRKASAESRAAALEALALFRTAFPACLEGRELRNMLLCSYRSGQAICMTRTTAAHALSYRISQTLSLPHGHACALTLPWLWMRLQAKKEAVPVLEKIESALCLEAGSGPYWFLGMLEEMHLPVTPPDLPSLAPDLARSVNQERLSNHPEVLTTEDLERICTLALSPLPGRIREKALKAWEAWHD